ncbi:UTP--glucose-1-phosphate uridylyltransferase GalU [Rhodospirillaceae bacterium]|jgi:UTP--glucose-1-phosphate uridylyltransferase|nr:UTP--glucose-1-phosphate uridylyltransferase GalU [Rhodospirillaceae bacterium]MDC0998280.1 UTP--glucose-1-phosphate uridylyltransferase GalU [Alphaproteobacteria bacterium]MBT6306387.1 UTP--glucose-1-phosphate uridylyltransferase GalU [Rhodospirillaceae bacterium]MBT7732866.1 UTP--glucose-1-phosphate uridylyltransferase GalU [Rhodospirillaceae bacterium]MDC1441775.1 UTP--glucose-1-phosphate uridylyltransferase GalU [Rhodospirillaceae bacterium]|tara:strand:- start:1045 stop:1914 length:870 start_codon:yes stop_codon:yes gene_type:complete
MPVNIRKAIFPVGGLGTRFLPATKSMPKEMLPIVDKPLIQYAVEEAIEAGIEEFIFVTGRGKSAIEDHFDHAYELQEMLEKRNETFALKVVKDSIPKPGQIAYTRQLEPLGLGHAIWCARNFVGSEPVAVLLADDLILSEKGCLKQMIEAYDEIGGNMLAVMEVKNEQTSSYGIITPGAVENSLIEVLGLIEKPEPSKAPSNLAIIGRYILQPSIFDDLGRFEFGAGGEIQLTDSIAQQVGLETINGFKFNGRRFDCGNKVGFLEANIAYALNREDLRDPIQQFIKTLS